MILVTGAGGGVGRTLVRELHGRGESVRAFVENDSQARTARADGASDVIVGDIRSYDDVNRATIGVPMLVHVNPTSIVREVAIAKNIVSAAHVNGTEHIVYHSVIHPDTVEMFHHREKGRVEEVFRRSEIPSTFLQASHFMQNYLDFWDFLRGGTLPYPSSPGSIMGVVDAEDVSEVSANILSAPQTHAGRTYDLSTEELTGHAMAEIWSDVLGHNVSAVRLPPTVVRNPLRGAAVIVTIIVKSALATNVRAPAHVLRGVVRSSNSTGVQGWSRESRDCYVSIMNYYDKNGLPAGDMTVLPTLLGRPATSYSQFATREAARRGVRPL